MSSLDQFINNKKLISFVGTGGVGKTTLSLACAIRAAQMGKKVAAITVDPSRRLSSVLGIDQKDKNSIQWKGFAFPLDVYYVDTERTFRNFVSHNMDEKLYEKIQSNKIFQQISKNLRETHNFAAIYQTVEVLKQESYDLVILDTPPCHQVIEFFESPRRLQKFFSPRDTSEQPNWLNWIQRKGLLAVEGFFSTLVGREFVEEMDSFFQTVGNLKSKINEVTGSFIDLLSANDSELTMICSPAKDKIAEAKYLTEELSKSDFKVSHLILNRAFVPDLDLSKELTNETDSREQELYNYFVGQRANSEKLLLSLQKAEWKKVTLSALPEMEMSLDSSDSVLQFVDHLGSSWMGVGE